MQCRLLDAPEREVGVSFPDHVGSDATCQTPVADGHMHQGPAAPLPVSRHLIVL